MVFAFVLVIIIVILVIQSVQYSSQHNSDTTKIRALEREIAELNDKIADLKIEAKAYLDCYTEADSLRREAITLAKGAFENSKKFFEASAKVTAGAISCLKSIKEVAGNLNTEDAARIIALCDEEIKKSQDFLDVVEDLADLSTDDGENLDDEVVDGEDFDDDDVLYF